MLASLLMQRSAAAETVWVVGNGFHSSLGLRAGDLPGWNFRGAHGVDHVLVGWGDAQWYRGQVTAGTFCSAVFWPTPSVLHVVPVRGGFAQRYPHSDVVRLELPRAQFAEFVKGLDGAFARDARGRVIGAGDGFQPQSHFFAGRESFYFPKMCNYWVAEKLQNGGLRISKAGSLTASGLMHQAARLGTREQSRRPPGDYF